MSPYWNSLRPIAVTEREQARRREPRGGHDAGGPSIDQDRDAATKRYEFLLIGGRDKDRRAGPGEFAQYGLDIEFCRDVDAPNQVVQQQNPQPRRPPQRGVGGPGPAGTPGAGRDGALAWERDERHPRTPAPGTPIEGKGDARAGRGARDGRRPEPPPAGPTSDQRPRRSPRRGD